MIRPVMPWSRWASSIPLRDAGEVLVVGEADVLAVVEAGDQLDVDRALGRAGREVLVGDVAVVVAGADRRGGLVVGRQEVQEVGPGERAVGAEEVVGRARCRCGAARRRIRSGVAVPSRWTCSSAFGIGATASVGHRSTSATIGVDGSGARVADRDRRLAPRPRAASAPASSRAWTTASGRPPRATAVPAPATASRPTAMSMTSLSTLRPPPRFITAMPERAGVVRDDDAVLVAGRPRGSPARGRGARRSCP